MLFAGGILLFTNLGSAALWDRDEPAHAQCAREMLLASDWIVPKFNGENRLEKPPLFYWLMTASYQVLGLDELGARAPSAVFGLLTLLLTYRLGRRLYDAATGLLASVILSTTLLFLANARAATPDSLLLFLSTAVLVLLAGQRFGAAPASLNPEADWAEPNRPRVDMAIAVLLGAAVLTKGPVGFLPLLPAGLYRFLTGIRHTGNGHGPWRVFRTTVRAMRPKTVLVVSSLVILPWFICFGIRLGGNTLASFLWVQNVQRFLQPAQNHGGPFFYYGLALLFGMFPWSVLLVPLAVHFVRETRAGAPIANKTLFLSCWILVFIAFYSLASTKLPHYVLPVYPACSLLLAHTINHWIPEWQTSKTPRRWILLAFDSLTVIGVLLAIAGWWVAPRLMPGTQILALVGLPVIAGGLAARYFIRRSRPLEAFRLFAGAGFVFGLAVFGLGATVVDRHQNARPLLEAIKARQGAQARIGTYRYFEPSLVFYHGSAVRRFSEASRARAFVMEEGGYLVTSESGRRTLMEDRAFRERVCDVTRLRRFLRSDYIYVLTGRPKHDKAPSSPQVQHASRRPTPGPGP